MYLLKRIVITSLLALSFVATGWTQTASGIIVQNGQKIAFLGDSITQFGWDRPGGYVRLVIAGLESAGVKATAIPAGVSGNTSRDMIARIDRDVISKKPDWMTLSCGVNDVWHGDHGGVDLETYKTLITSIVDKVQAAGIKVVILTTTVINESDNPNNQKLVAYNDFLRQLAAEKKCPLVDMNAAFWAAIKAQGTHRTGFTMDGVHMNPAGNMLMARTILLGLGLTPAQADKYEADWRNSPDATAALGQVAFNGSTGISMADYARLQDIARERKVSFLELQNDLLFDALRVVLKAHEQDAALTPQQIQAETQKAFGDQVQALAKAGK